MLRFKQHLAERSQDIRNSDIVNAKTYDEALEKIKNISGSRKLGDGMYAIVFGGNGNLVIKLSGDIDGTYYYLKEIYEKKLWLSNPHFPRIGFLKLFNKHHRDISQQYMVIMEHLDFDSHWIKKLCDGNIYLIGKAYDGFLTEKNYSMGESYVEAWHKLKEIMPKMAEVFELIFSIFKNNSNDIGVSNIGYRYSNKKLVIVDPLT